MKNETKPSIILGWLICAFGALFYCYEYLLRIEPSVMVTQLMQTFNVNAAAFGFLSGLYYVAYTPMQIFVGMITDRYGPRRVLTMAVIACALGALIFGETNSYYIAGLGRFLIGFGSAFAFVGVMKLAAVWLPSNRFALFAGLATSLGMVGAMVGDVELSILVHKLGWRETLYWSTIVGAVLTPLIYLVVRDGPKKLTASEKKKVRFKDTLQEVLALAKNPQMWLIGIVGCILYLSLTVFAELWGIQFLGAVYKFSHQDAADATSIVFLGWLFGGPVMGWMSDYLKTRKWILFIGCSVSIFIASYLIFAPQLLKLHALILLFLYGFFSSAEILCFAMARDMVESRFAGTAVAFVNMLIMFGGMVFQPFVGYLLDVVWNDTFQDGIRVYTAHDYRQALAVIPIALVVGIVVSLFLKQTYNEK